MTGFSAKVFKRKLKSVEASVDLRYRQHGKLEATKFYFVEQIVEDAMTDSILRELNDTQKAAA